MPRHVRLYTLTLSIALAPALAAGCSRADSNGTTEPGPVYDALVGTWNATTFVVSDHEASGDQAVDLVQRRPGRRGGRDFRLEFRHDRTGSLRAETAEGEPGGFLDSYSVLEVTDRTLTVAARGDGIAETVEMEYFVPKGGRSVTLRFWYPIDIDASGDRSRCQVVATFARVEQ
jgi:hypothetical protein